MKSGEKASIFRCMGWLLDWIDNNLIWSFVVELAFGIGLLLYRRLKAKRKKTEE